MKFLGFTAAMCLCTLIAMADTASAQRYINDCTKARSTSDTMKCVKKRVETAQAELNDLYKKTLDIQSGNSKTPLGETQQSWIAYRDAQCSWEAAQAEQGQEKIYELSCLAALTTERISVLEAMNKVNQSSRPREYSSHPRWMNALAEDHPDVLWKYSQWLQADIDCDGEDEEVMTGVTMRGGKDGKPFMRDGKEDTQGSFFKGPLYKAEAVIALSENVSTGRSKTTLFRLPVGQNEQTNYFCNVPQSIEFIEDPTEDDAIDDKEQNGAPACNLKLQVADGNCHPAVISWDGTKYHLQKEQVDISEKKLDKE